MIAAAIMSTGALSGGGNPPGVPVASFGFTPGNPTHGVPTTFIDHSTNNPTSWSWSIGGVQFSTSQNPTYTVPSTGLWQITLVASNAYGSSQPDPQNIYFI